MNDLLVDVEATAHERQRLRKLVSKVMRYEGKRRFVGKLTGPARIGYLSSIFPDARFIHVIRDGRAVVHSLLKNHPGWRDTFRLHEPAWSGVSEAELERWKRSGESPLGLAAIEWRAVVEAARSEAAEVAPDRYLELRYEDFLADPHRKLDEVTAFCELPRSTEAHSFLDRRVQLRDMNYQWRDGLDSAEVRTVEELAGDLLSELGYQPIESRRVASASR